MEEVRLWLIAKFVEIRKRSISAIEQLDDTQVNWRPNDFSNSVGNLVFHIQGNVSERITQGIHGQPVQRNRDEEFEPQHWTKRELLTMMDAAMSEVIRTLHGMTEADWTRTQRVRNRERTNMDMLLQCAAHFSEHMGQILYLAKWIQGDDYVTTSILRKRSD